jgi:hypothetical protein
MTTHRTAVLTTGILASAALAFMTNGVATAVPDEDVLAAADLNGDGVEDQVTVRSVGTADQRVVARVDGKEVAIDAPAETSIVRPPRVTDLNGDGADELVVREQTGANTEAFGVWDYADGALRQVATKDGHPLKLYEGGGVMARSGYRCEDGQLVVLRAEADVTTTPKATYTGSWTYYSIADGVVTPSEAEVSFTEVGAESPLLSPDTGTCAG